MRQPHATAGRRACRQELSPEFARRPLAALGLTGLAIAAFGAARPAEAQSIDDVLGKKKLQVGILVDLPPFGVVNAKGGYEGYDVDVATLMAKYLGVELELVPVTGPNRIPYLLTSKVDVLVAIFGITPERARQVQFSIPYSSIDIVLMAPKDVKIASAADLKPLKVGRRARQHAGHRDQRRWRRRAPASCASTTTPPPRRRCCRIRSTRSA